MEEYKDDAGESVPETLHLHCKNHHDYHDYQGQQHMPANQQAYSIQRTKMSHTMPQSRASMRPTAQQSSSLSSKVQPAATPIVPHQDRLDLGQKYAAKEALLDKFTADPDKNPAGPYVTNVTNDVPVIFPKHVLKSIKPCFPHLT